MLKLLALCILCLPLFQCLLNPRKLGCERMLGNFADVDTTFKRPMEEGDKFIVNGVVSNPGNIVIINLANNNSDDIALHIRADLHATWYFLIWDSYVRGQWTGQERTPMPYHDGQPFDINIEYSGTTYEVNFNGKFLYSYRLRTPSNHHTVQGQVHGSVATNYIEMVCKNPPPPPSPPPPSRPPGRPPVNGGGHGGHGHGHGSGGHGHGGKFSSSSDESRE